jgi:hypothetical protein
MALLERAEGGTVTSKGFGRLLAIVASCLTVLLAMTAPAHAADGPATGGKDTSLPTEAELQSSQDGEATIEAVLPGNPLSCYGFTDNPHESDHNPGNAITAVRTECYRGQASRQYAYGEMYRDRWYGLQFLDDASSTYFYTYAKVRALPIWYCNGVGTYTYRTWGYHQVTISGTIYDADTYNDNRFPC